MSNEDFINRLRELAETDRAAMAALRRSLAHPPGEWPAAFPYVERFTAAESDYSPRRRAAYLVAGLFAVNPIHLPGQSLGAACRKLAVDHNAESVERRFRTLLEADGDLLPDRLKRMVDLLAGRKIGLDYARLQSDLAFWDHPESRARRNWARDFYAPLQKDRDDQTAGHDAPQTATVND